MRGGNLCPMKNGKGTLAFRLWGVVPPAWQNDWRRGGGVCQKGGREKKLRYLISYELGPLQPELRE